ncbi:MAG: TonB family protein [Bacteroidales bacterium]
MTEILPWILEPAISLSLFYLAYVLFLKKEAFFRANRYYLLSAMIFSFALPFLNITPPVSITNYSFLIPEVEITGTALYQEVQEGSSEFSTGGLLTTLYLVVAVILFGRLALRMAQLYLLIARNKWTRFENAFIVNLRSEQAPFSFMNFIFINSSHYTAEEEQKIIEHELVHIGQYHTIDLLILELLTILQWFNPFAWLFRKSMIEVHEYLADYEMIKKGTNISFYQTLLLNLQIGREFFLPANNFNKSLTLNRIRMMTTIRPPSWRKVKFILLIPAILSVVLMCTKTDEELPTEFNQPLTAVDDYILHDEIEDQEVSPAENEFVPPVRSDNNDVFFIVEEMPDFQGKGQDGFREYIAQNLRYPQIAAENGVQGRVFVQFIVKADGSVANAQIVRSIDPALDREAIRVVMSSPKWEPGRQRGQAVDVAFTFPINFVLQ